MLQTSPYENITVLGEGQTALRAGSPTRTGSMHSETKSEITASYTFILCFSPVPRPVSCLSLNEDLEEENWRNKIAN